MSLCSGTPPRPGDRRSAKNASYSWTLGGYKPTAQLNVENLADTRYYPTGVRGPLQVDVGTPRAFEGVIRVAF